MGGNGDIKKIHIAHEFILDRAHKCEYSTGRGLYGLVYVLKGRAEYRFLGGARVTVTDGDVIFLSPDAAYSIMTEKDFCHYTVNFHLHEEGSSPCFENGSYCILQGANTEQIRRSFSGLVSLWSLKKSGYEMQAIGKLYELMSLFYFDFYNTQRVGGGQRLKPAREYVERNFNEPLSLLELARLSDMSVTNFRREWKKAYGDTPLQYRDGLRLYYAKEYLSSGYYTVSEIAGKCGFDDSNYFSRFFKRQTGLSPMEYKNQYIA